MEAKRMGRAMVGMERAMRAEGADATGAIEKLSKMGGSEAGGFIAGLALSAARKGSFDDAAMRSAATLARVARKEFTGHAEEDLEFLVWLRGGLAAAASLQGRPMKSMGEAFSGAYQEQGRDEWVDLMMTQPFFSTKECPNASDMASVVEAMGSTAAGSA